MPAITCIPATKNLYTALPMTDLTQRRTAAYARVSTDSDEQYTSYEAQVDYYTKYIREHAEWTFAGVYTDKGITGTSITRRDGFNQMVTDGLAGKIDLIITKSVSRFARNTVDSLVTIRKLKEKGVEVYFEEQNIWTLDSKGELLITILSSLAQEESRSISENVTWGQRKRFADGKVSLPYKHFLGYDKGEEGTPVINEKEADIVRLIYRLFMDGKTPSGIGRQLEEMGIPTPAGKRKWSQTTVISILQNEKYKGDALLQKSFTVDFLTKKLKTNEGEVPQYYVEGSHEAIIPPREFDMVQAEIARRKQAGRSYSGGSPFSSKLVCADCGGFYGQKVWHSTDAYRKTIWRCNAKFKGDTKCSTPTLDSDRIKQMFLKAYNQLLGNREQVIGDCLAMQAMLTDCSSLDEEIRQVNEELEVIAGLVKSCVHEHAEKAQDQEAFDKKYAGLLKRHDKAAAQFERLKAKKDKRQEQRLGLQVFIDALRNQPLVLDTWDEQVWNLLVERGVVGSDESMSFEFKDGSRIRMCVLKQLLR